MVNDQAFPAANKNRSGREADPPELRRQERQQERQPEQGAALILALIVLFLTTSALLLGSSLLGSSFRRSRAELVSAQLRALVDGGIAWTLAELCRDRASPGFGPRQLSTLDPVSTTAGLSGLSAAGLVEAEITLLTAKRARAVVRASLAGRQRQARLEIDLSGALPAVTRYWEGANDPAFE